MDRVQRVLAQVFPTGTIMPSITLLLQVTILLLSEIRPLQIACWFQALSRINCQVMELVLHCHLVAMIFMEGSTMLGTHREVSVQEPPQLNRLLHVLYGPLQMLSDFLILGITSHLIHRVHMMTPRRLFLWSVASTCNTNIQWMFLVFHKLQTVLLVMELHRRELAVWRTELLVVKRFLGGMWCLPATLI